QPCTISTLYLHRSPPPPHRPCRPTRRSSDLPPLLAASTRITFDPSTSGTSKGGEREWSPSFVNRSGSRERLHSSTPSGSRRKGTDRKSTRLNSSHVAISYAVFCLKKKKKTHN